MEIEILKKEENKLYNRTEYDLLITHEKSATPSRAEIIKEFSKQIKKEPELTIARRVSTGFATNVSKAKINQYIDKESLEKFESKHFIKKSQLKQEESVEEKKQEPKPEPKEEKKEEGE